MGFQQGLSGLDAASKQLDVIGNNIANASTVGFKGSRAEFGDMYANSFYGVSATQAGIGVQTLDVAQQMTQGNITTTNNNLDIAINNNGFFIVKTGASTSGTSSGTLEYTRNGEFQVDNQGYIVNGADRLQGWPAVNGTVTQGATGDLQLQTSLIAPNPTSTVDMGVNLDSRNTVPTTAPFSPTTPASYNWSNSTSVYDTLGNAHNLTMYYVKTAANTWSSYAYVDGTAATVTPKGGAAAASAALTFSTTGTMSNVNMPWTITYAPTTGATTPETFTLDYTGSTQYGQTAGTNSLTNDGYAAGTVSSINIDSSGIMQATYTNGQTKTIGQIALANFTNQQGLQPLGNNRWEQTYSSGPAQVNAPGSGTAGTLRDSALEASNVDLTTELVNLITAQRFYQANAQTIKAEDTVQQTLVNL
jgi:flagellar hook protein FlgE